MGVPIASVLTARQAAFTVTQKLLRAPPETGHLDFQPTQRHKEG